MPKTTNFLSWTRTILFMVLVHVLFVAASPTTLAGASQPCFVLPDPKSLITTVKLAVVARRVTVPSPTELNLTIAYTARVLELQNPPPRCITHKSERHQELYSIPGPTLVVVPGGTLRISLVNELTSKHEGMPHATATNQDDSAHRNNMWHKINTTNIHTHGLHVDPAIDDPFRHIQGGETGEYTIRIPKDHPPGTFFYHPHVHGATALHMMSGMYGLILVEYPETIGTLPFAAITTKDELQFEGPSVGAYLAHSTAPRERSPRAQVLQSFREAEAKLKEGMTRPVRRIVATLGLLKFSPKADPSPFNGWSFLDLERVFGATSVPLQSNATLNVDLVTVNGAFQPTWRITAHEPVLVQLVYSAAFSQIRVRIPPICEASVLAADGISYAEPRRVDSLMFVPATRYDILLLCHRSGRTRVLMDLGAVDGAYRNKARRLGIEEHVLWNFDVLPNDNNVSSTTLPQEHTAQDQRGPLATVLHRLLRGKFLKRPSIEQADPYDKARWSRKRVYGCTAANNCFRHDVSLAQKLSITNPELTQQILAPLPSGQYSLGHGPNCAASPTENKTCFYEPFQGSRGKNLTAYQGFVVPYGSVVELRMWSDPEDTVPHPMHFHVHHFQLVDYQPFPSKNNSATGLPQQQESRNRGAEAEALAMWGLQLGDIRDTIPVLPGVTTVRWRVTDFTGEVVYHCHTLSHEDLGMMSSYYVSPPSNDDPNRKPKSLLPSSKYSGIVRAQTLQKNKKKNDDDDDSDDGVVYVPGWGKPPPRVSGGPHTNKQINNNGVSPSVNGDASGSGEEGEQPLRLTPSHNPFLLALLICCFIGGVYGILKHVLAEQ